MNNEVFEQTFKQAFDQNEQPILTLVESLLNDLNLEDDDIETFYQKCVVHFSVAKSTETDEVKTAPVHNVKLWFTSLIWLIDNLEKIHHYSNIDDKFTPFYDIRILWWHKWLLTGVVEHPDVTLTDINLLNDKMYKYFTEYYNVGTRSIYKCRVVQGIKMGNKQMVEVNLYEWLEAPEHDFDDCWACQVDDIVRSFCFLKRYDKALSWSTDILNGEVTCGEVPHATNSLIAEAFFNTGQLDKAKAILNKGYPLIQGKLEFICPIAEFMRLYRQIEPQRAIDIYHDNIALIEVCESPFDSMLFHIEASHMPVPNQAVHKQHAKQLAKQFDDRNGNSYYQNQL